jgi:hypothetical protein
MTSSWQQQAAQVLQLTLGSLGNWRRGMVVLMARSVRENLSTICCASAWRR